MSVSAEEVAKHNTDKDCWVIVGDQVLDVTNFLSHLFRKPVLSSLFIPFPLFLSLFISFLLLSFHVFAVLLSNLFHLKDVNRKGETW